MQDAAWAFIHDSRKEWADLKSKEKTDFPLTSPGPLDPDWMKDVGEPKPEHLPIERGDVPSGFEMAHPPELYDERG